jgi:PPOX class probable F420-dependent enzyme
MRYEGVIAMMNTTTSNHQGITQNTIHRYLSLTAFTSEGEPLTVTTWFAAHDGVIYVALPATSALVGTIRRHGAVAMLPSSRNGEARGHSVAGLARIVPQFETAEARAALDHKYGVVAGVSHLITNDQGFGNEVLIAIRPESGLGTDDLLRETPTTATDDTTGRLRIAGLAVAGALLGAGIALAIITRRRGRAA